MLLELADPVPRTGHAGTEDFLNNFVLYWRHLVFSFAAICSITAINKLRWVNGQKFWLSVSVVVVSDVNVSSNWRGYLAIWFSESSTSDNDMSGLANCRALSKVRNLLCYSWNSGPSYMVSGTRDNPPPETTLGSVYMWKRLPYRPSQSWPCMIIHNPYWIFKCADVLLSLSFPRSFNCSWFCKVNFYFLDTNFCFNPLI